MTQFEELIGRLTASGVEFIIVGGFASAIHGAVRVTEDLDVVYHNARDNLDRLVGALAPLNPYPRGAVPGLPFTWNRISLEFGANFTLATSLGYIDVLADITGGGGYGHLLPFAISVTLFGRQCLCLDLPKLIAVKRAAGRPKDFEAIAELEALAEERAKQT